jgi:hypothetical protein
MPLRAVVRSHLETNVEHYTCQYIAPSAERLFSLPANLLTEPLNLRSAEAYHAKDGRF